MEDKEVIAMTLLTFEMMGL